MDPLAALLGESSAVVALREKVRSMLQKHAGARRLPAVLIQGETGTGKGLVAQALHRAGPRADGPFVDVNCAAIPATLLEAEMFGFERGAFTDARQAKPGLFQVANRGVLFLDEIGLLASVLQSKLLKVLDTRVVRRLGGTRNEPVDVWVVAATNEDLTAAVRDGRFREDLYYRLAVLTLSLPPLRERGDDILVLADHFLARASADYGLIQPELAPGARSALRAYPWPGNVRELANVMDRVVLLADQSVISAEALGLPRAVAAATASRPLTAMSMDDRIREHLAEVLAQTGWNISQAAVLLGVTRNTLRARMEKYDLRRNVGGSAAARRRPSMAPAVAPPENALASAPAPVVRRRVTFLRVAFIEGGAAPAFHGRGRLLELTRDKARSFGGRVEVSTPIAMLATFGIEPVEDAPRRAASAALAILRAAYQPGQQIKIGVHVSEVTVRSGTLEIDQEGRDEAAMLLDDILACVDVNGDAVVVSETARPFLDRRFDLVPVGPGPPTAYRLAGAERKGLRIGQRVAQFVGRQHEFGLMRSLLEVATGGRGQVVGIMGAPGIGKSRLLIEFSQSVAAPGRLFLDAHCLSYTKDVPYAPVAQLVRGLCGIVETDEPAAIAGKVDTALSAVRMSPERGAYLLHLLGVKEGTAQTATAAPEIIKARISETICQLSAARARQDVLVILVEDLHWVDHASQELLVALVETVAVQPILAIYTYRPDYSPPWLHRSNVTQIALQGLTAQESRTIVQSAFHDAEVPDAVVNVIVAKADGNPFFLEELARSIREQGTAAPLLPATIQDVLFARISRLPDDERTVLASAAIIGNSFAFPLLQAIIDRPEDVIWQCLARLERSEFIYRTVSMANAVGEARYAFKHALTRDVAYESIPEGQRRHLHGRILDAAEILYRDRLGEHVEALAHHAFQGERWEQAVMYLQQAGAKAALRSASLEAVSRFERALQCFEHLPKTRANLERAIDLRFALRNPLFVLAEFERALNVLGDVVGMAEALGDPDRVARACSFMANAHFMLGNVDRGLELAERVRSIATQLGDTTLLAMTSAHLGQLFYSKGIYPDAVAMMRQCVEGLEREQQPRRPNIVRLYSVVAHSFAAMALARLGAFGEAIASGERGREIAETTDTPFVRALAAWGLGSAYLARGEVASAVAMLEAACADCDAADLRALRPWIATDLGYAYLLSTPVTKALTVLEHAVRQADSLKLLAEQSLRVAHLGEGYLRAGRRHEAAMCGRRALELASAHGECGFRAWVLRLLGNVAGSGTDPDLPAVQDQFDEAITLATELGLRPLVAHCHADLAAVYRRGGVPERAQEHAARAAELYREMGMQFWLAQVEAGLGG